MRLSWNQARGVVALSAALMALQGAPAIAQFVPYTGSPNPGYDQYQAYSAQQAQPQYAQPQYTQPQHAAMQQTVMPHAAVPQQGFQPYGQPQYTAMAFQGSDTRPATPTLSQPAEAVAPGQMMQSAPAQSYSPAPAATPAPMSYESYSMGGTGACGTYNTFENNCGLGGAYTGVHTGCCDAGACGYGCGCRSGCRWFGGIYGLYMERDGNPWKTLAFSSTSVADGYYPTDTEYVLNLTDIDNDTFGGAEFRFGTTIGHGGPCGCGPRCAWEVAYWGLAEDTVTATVTDTTTDGTRLYSMIDYRGLEYDPGTGYRPVNDYYDFAPPVNNPVGVDTVRVRQLTVRNSFSLQNVEANLIHLQILGGGGCCGAGGYGPGLGGRAFGHRGGCAGGGCDSCAGGCCSTGGCCCAPRCSVSALAGFRYIRTDEDFMFRSDYENETTSATGFLAHNIDVDSHLIGGQVGCNAIYHCGCQGRWALHCNTTFGVYNNHVEVWNRMDSPTDSVRYVNNGSADFDVRYEDDDVAFVGELRAGASYRYSCHCRIYGGYRVFGIGGAALAFDQITTPSFNSPAHTSYVDSDGSIFLHGLQGGVEFNY